ncbi:MAG: ABC transporter ATP-binding protein [Gemmatimonadetes bacterium]|nr:ABC transporter ATP-binding protein [Gemmatimonadota bacterium]
MTAQDHHEEDALGKAYDAHLMRRLLRYLRPYRPRVALAILLLLASSLLEVAGPWLTKLALDRAVPAHDVRRLGLLASAYLGALVLGFALEYAQTILTTWLGQRVMYDLRQKIFGHLQRMGLPFFDRNPVGRLMTRVTNDVEALNDLFSSGVVTIFGDVFTLGVLTAAMVLVDWRLALVTLAVMPLVFWVAMVFRTKFREAYRDIRTRLARINAFLQEHLSGIAVVQLFGREMASSERFREIGDDYLAAHLRSVTYYALFFPIIELLTAVAFALIVAYGGSEVLAGGLTVGTVFAFLQWARRFFRPIQDLSEKYNMLQGAMAASERIFKLLDTPEASNIPPEPLHLPTPSRGEIEFRNVWFAYQRRSPTPQATPASSGRPGDLDPGAAAADPALEPEKPSPISSPGPKKAGALGPETGREIDTADWDWVLKDLSFTIRPGERVAVVGHTGAGKTSLISLLMRFYEPQRGEILFDGVPISRVPVEEVRRRIGLVLQDVFLFSRDIDYNIRLGDRDIPDAAVRAAARRVGADRFIERLPRRYHEPLGERGASLSVGERQLLSFARALAFDPLVLVLDEATSSVDSALEAQIERALETLMEGRTTLAIAHRLSTIQHADRILVLHHGELREQGTHRELLARGGIYARLHELQFASRDGAAPVVRREPPGASVVAGGG